MKLRLTHLDLIITIQSQKVLKHWYFASKGTQTLVLCEVKDFFDAGSNVFMIKRSALPKGIITKLLGDMKTVRTLEGHLKMQKVVTMQDLNLPEFDKNRHIKQQKVLVFDNNNVKRDHPEYKLAFQDLIQVKLLKRKFGMV